MLLFRVATTVRDFNQTTRDFNENVIINNITAEINTDSDRTESKCV